MKKALLILSLIVITSSVFCKDIPKETAIKAATNYYFQAVNSLSEKDNIKFERIDLTCIQDPTLDDSKHVFIFNVNNDMGFIIVSSDDNIKPILAYSFESSFNVDNISPSQQYLLDYYELMNSEANLGNLQNSDRAKKEWEKLEKFNFKQTYKSKTTVEGLLGLINWNQSKPYNSMCPEAENTPNGYGGRCPVGCSAISMLQIMKYYNWPFSGTGSYTHYSDDNGGHGDFTVNFEENTYDWYSMPNDAEGPNDELAKICFHAGVAIKMYWTAGGSGASIVDVANSLITNFKYNENIELLEKDYYGEEEWKDIIRDQINEKKPVVYVGYTDVSGHGWNCDGYQGEDHFHMNWGWGGYGNGFYTLDALGTTATPGSSEGNYNQWQTMLINIYPKDPYPSFCSEETIINGDYGSFDDGSSFENYQNNSSCKYIIEPECRQIIQLNFTKFELSDGDYINLWDGSPEDNILLKTFNIDSLPTEENYEAISGKMTLEFVTDNISTNDGWAVDFNTKNCVSKSIYTDTSGTFDDGSKDCEYTGGTLCSWYIQPEGNNTINIDFEYFDVSGDINFVKIYKDAINTNNVIATFDQNNIPDEILTVNSDTAIVRFFAASNSSLGEGWKINYTSSYNNIAKNYFSDDFFISPNPGGVNSNIIINSENYDEAIITIYNIPGEIIGKHKTNLIEGENRIQLSSITEIKQNGMYFITIRTNNKSYSLPFILSE